jgi:hypothetical protein
MTKAQMFLQASQPDSDGKTRLWLYSELETLYPGVEFQTKNGGDWNRSDGQLRDFIVYREKDKNRTIGIRLDGYKETSIQKRIRFDISKTIKKERCRVVDVGGQLARKALEWDFFEQEIIAYVRCARLISIIALVPGLYR